MSGKHWLHANVGRGAIYEVDKAAVSATTKFSKQFQFNDSQSFPITRNITKTRHSKLCKTLDVNFGKDDFQVKYFLEEYLSME